MRTTLMVALLTMSLGLTATCLIIVRLNVRQQIRASLASDLNHSLATFENIGRQRNKMLAREAALLADLPSLKALMATQDVRTIQDGSQEFWRVSGGDFFALANADGTLETFSNHGVALVPSKVAAQVHQCLSDPAEPHLLAFGQILYEVSVQPVFFGPAANGSQLGFVTIGYAIDDTVASEVSEASAADVAFLAGGKIAVTTLTRQQAYLLDRNRGQLRSAGDAPGWVDLGGERYMATSVLLPAAGDATVQLVVLKSYDRASIFLSRLNRWILFLGGATFLIGLVLAAAISRTVTRPLENLVAGARALGTGNFSFSLSPHGAAEVRELSHAFDFMRGELRKTQQQLLESERLATIGRMASSVSHDLRHHLSAIYANAEFLSSEKTAATDRYELFLEVRSAIESMTEMIESLLLFSQTRQALAPRRKSINLLIERVADMVRMHPEARDVKIVIQPHASIEAWVDDPKLGRALYNLILNGCQAAAPGGRRALVSVSCEEDGDGVAIDICDTGVGVPDTIRKTLFEPFVSAGKQNGTGLGLTLAQHIAQEHGGSVILQESSPGRTVFRLRLFKSALEPMRSGKQDMNRTAGEPRSRLQ